MRLIDNTNFKNILSEIQVMNIKFQQNPIFTRLLDFIVNNAYNVDGNSEIFVKSDIGRIGYLISFLHHVSNEYLMSYKVQNLALCLKDIENGLQESFPDEPERMPNDFSRTPPRQTRHR